MISGGDGYSSSPRRGHGAHTHRWNLLAPHRQRLVALARRHGAGSEAEDVAHEAMLRAATSDALDEQRPGPYMMKIALNLVMDRHRRHANEQRLSRHAGLLPRQRAVDDGAADRDEARRALQRLAGAEPAETVAMVLRYADGARAHELGQEFGTSASAAKARVLRALHRIRGRLRPHSARG